jgi:hypothetical protein
MCFMIYQSTHLTTRHITQPKNSQKISLLNLLISAHMVSIHFHMSNDTKDPMIIAGTGQADLSCKRAPITIISHFLSLLRTTLISVFSRCIKPQKSYLHLALLHFVFNLSRISAASNLRRSECEFHGRSG